MWKKLNNFIIGNDIQFIHTPFIRDIPHRIESNLKNIFLKKVYLQKSKLNKHIILVCWRVMQTLANFFFSLFLFISKMADSNILLELLLDGF